jgi:hypothetical protein
MTKQSYLNSVLVEGKVFREPIATEPNGNVFIFSLDTTRGESAVRILCVVPKFLVERVAMKAGDCVRVVGQLTETEVYVEHVEMRVRA